MSPLIISDSKVTREILTDIMNLCEAHGASWHPSLNCEIAHGEMRVTAPVGTTGLLIRLPATLLVPWEGAQWSAREDRLVMEKPPVGLSRVQRALLDLHVILYNETGKLQWYLRHHPESLVARDEPLADAVRRIKPRYLTAPQANGLAEGFLKTRSILCASEPPRGRSEQRLMPIVDLLNHHPHGTPYSLTPDALAIDTAQPAGTTECFARYGDNRDVVGLALYYGYVDHTTPYAHSVPLDDYIEGIGRLRIGQSLNISTRHPLDPPLITSDDEGLYVSHLRFDAAHPNRSRGLFTLALVGHLASRGVQRADADRLAQEAIEHVRKENVNALRRLAVVAEHCRCSAGDLLAQAAQRQATIIERVIPQGGDPTQQS